MPSMKTRIQHKRDTASNWAKVDSSFVPRDGEIILYDTKAGTVRMKIGDGSKTVGSLPFIDEAWKNLILAGVEDADTWRTIQVDGEDVLVDNDGKKLNFTSNSARVSLYAEENADGDIDFYIDAQDPRVLQQDLNAGTTKANNNYPLTFSASPTTGSKTGSLYKNKHLTYNPELNRLLIGAAAIEDGKFIAPSIQLGGTVTTDEEGNIITDQSSGTVIEVKEDGSISGNFSGNFTGTLEGAAGDIAGAKTLVDADGELISVGSDKAPVYFENGVPVAISSLKEAAWKDALETNEGFENSTELPTAKVVSAYVEGKGYATKSDLQSGNFSVKNAEEANHSKVTSGFDETALGIIKETTVNNALNANNALQAKEAEHAGEADHALNADDALRAINAENAKEAEHAEEADYALESSHADEADVAKKVEHKLTIGNVEYDGSADVSAPTASTTISGITKLTNSIDEVPQENLAATPKLVADSIKAVQDAFEIDYNKSVIGMKVEGNIVTYTTADGQEHQIINKDSGASFSIGDSEFPGLTKLYATTGTWEDGSLTVKAISDELNKKINYDDVVIVDNTLKFDATLANN